MRGAQGIQLVTLEIQPITWAEACAFINQHHRHHIAPQGWKWGLAVNDGSQVVGVITVGLPIARLLMDGWTLEITRCCTDGTKNACSKLYSAAWRAARAMGYRRIITYTLADEPGNSLRASGFQIVHQTKGGSWDRRDRPRVDKHLTTPKMLWEVRA